MKEGLNMIQKYEQLNYINSQIQSKNNRFVLFAYDIVDNFLGRILVEASLSVDELMLGLLKWCFHAK